MESNERDSLKAASSTPKVILKKPKKLFKFRFLCETSLHNVRRDQIYFYIISLHKKIRALLRKCKKYREKLLIIKKNNAKMCEASSLEKGSSDNDEKPVDETTTTAATAEPNPNSFIADIKNAAHQAQNDTGFIYEPTSGLYYDSRTGYYYNAEHGLYYDGNNGCYYSYNQTENKFEFHSQVYTADEISAAATAKNEQVADSVDCILQQFAHLHLVDCYRANALDTVEKRKRRRQKSTDSNRKKMKIGSKKKSSKHKKHADSNSDDEQKEDGEISDDENDSDEESTDREAEERRDRSHRSKHRNRSILTQRRLISYDSDDDDDDDDDEKYGKYDSGRSYTSSSESGRISPNAQAAFTDIAKKYPPSLRIIVQETNLRKLKIGELFLITYKGGSLGREGKHDVIIPDINCSKYHLKFEYDGKDCCYTCIDLGSRNGTLMNGKRMSNAKQESEPMKLVHGTVLQIGQTKLLCHIHDGYSTCGQCEPGLLGGDTDAVGVAVGVAVAGSSSTSKIANVNDDHKRQLKNLKKRYGLQDEKYLVAKVDAKNDRAENRRKAVGSTCEHEKTKTASLNASIPSENKGFKMLSKLGWSEGQALGKNSDGLLEPIPLKGNEKHQGLGCESGSAGFSESSSNDPKRKHKTKIWQKTQQRYNAAEAAVDIFKNCSDDSD